MLILYHWFTVYFTVYFILCYIFYVPNFVKRFEAFRIKRYINLILLLLLFWCTSPVDARNHVWAVKGLKHHIYSNLGKWLGRWCTVYFFISHYFIYVLFILYCAYNTVCLSLLVTEYKLLVPFLICIHLYFELVGKRNYFINITTRI